MWVGAAIWAGIRWSVGGKAAIEVIVGRGGRIGPLQLVLRGLLERRGGPVGYEAQL